MIITAVMQFFWILIISSQWQIWLHFGHLLWILKYYKIWKDFAGVNFINILRVRFSYESAFFAKLN